MSSANKGKDAQDRNHGSDKSNGFLRAVTQKGERSKELDSTLLGFQPSGIIENEVGSESAKNVDLYSSYGK